MAFRYIGDKDEVTAFDLTFEKGKPVRVDDKRAIGKLTGHPDFEEVDGRRKSEDDES